MFRCLTPPISSASRCRRSRTSSRRPMKLPTAEVGGRVGGGRSMPIEILMPALSPTMTEGNVTKWLKREGEEVHSGDVLAEIETDKATMEFEAVDDGRLGKILVPEGAQGVKVNQPIAVLLAEVEKPAPLKKSRNQPPNPAAAPKEEASVSPPPVQPAQRDRGGNGR